jgi:hypothetical protein
MASFSLITLTRDSFIFEFGGIKYSVNGERGADVWDIFPKMIYRLGASGERVLLEDEALSARIVSALQAHWPEYGHPWELNVVKD